MRTLYTASQRVASNFNKALLLIGLSLVVAGLIGLLYAQPTTELSQDVRTQATVELGPVLTGMTSDENVSQLDGQYGLEVNLEMTTSGYQVSEAQYVLSIVDNGVFRSPEISVSSGSGVLLDTTEIQQTSDGYLALITLVPENGSTFSFNSPSQVVSMLFVPAGSQGSGQVTISFDTENSYALISQPDGEFDGLQNITPVTFTYPLSQPDSSPDPGVAVLNEVVAVNWQTNYVTLAADDLDIGVGNAHFDSFDNLRLTSDPPEDSGDSYTTLEASWQEGDVEMRLFLYIYRVNDTWTIEEARTYDGENPGDWVYYTNPVVQVGPGAGSKISGEVGDSYQQSGSVILYADSNGPGYIALTNPLIRAFTNEDQVGGATTKQCNQSCSSNSECQVGHMCYQTNAGSYCRLSTNPSSTTCAASSSQDQNQSQTTVQSCNEECSSNNDCDINLRCYYNQCRLATNPSSSSCTAVSDDSLSDLYDQEDTPKGGDIEDATDSADASDSAELIEPPPQDWGDDVVDRTNLENNLQPEENPSWLDRVKDFFGKTDQLAVTVMGVGAAVLVLGFLWSMLSKMRSKPSGGNDLVLPPVGAPKTSAQRSPESPSTPAQPIAQPPVETTAQPPSQQTSQPPAAPQAESSPSSSMMDRMKQKGVEYGARPESQAETPSNSEPGSNIS